MYSFVYWLISPLLPQLSWSLHWSEQKSVVVSWTKQDSIYKSHILLWSSYVILPTLIPCYCLFGIHAMIMLFLLFVTSYHYHRYGKGLKVDVTMASINWIYYMTHFHHRLPKIFLGMGLVCYLLSKICGYVLGKRHNLVYFLHMNLHFMCYYSMWMEYLL